MASVGMILGPFLVYWLILFGVCYIVTEFAQNYFYDEATPRIGLKMLGGSFLLAALLTYTRSRFDTMFTTDIGWTILQAMVWFGVFLFVFQFHPWHAAAVGISTMLIIAGVASMAVESLSNSMSRTPAPVAAPSRPVRRPSGSTFIPTAPSETAKQAAEPAK